MIRNNHTAFGKSKQPQQYKLLNESGNITNSTNSTVSL